jgi:hypothetical protein
MAPTGESGGRRRTAIYESGASDDVIGLREKGETQSGKTYRRGVVFARVLGEGREVGAGRMRAGRPWAAGAAGAAAAAAARLHKVEGLQAGVVARSER